MKRFSKMTVYIIIGAIIFLTIIGFIWTIGSSFTKNQKIFEQGSLLGMIPDGRYRGSIDVPQKSWVGKKFDREQGKGVNIVSLLGKESESFPFITRIEKGSHDSELDVLVLDYNLPENPWWLRRVKDEVVEVSPSKYLGKVHFRFFPGYPFTIGFFHLER
ncbi:MAG: hypothetical protein KBD73_01985 [Candidatus Magasanikbacteria bacterium]|nr:hypothetical protein [Candidatus Magasanikbacteria bacterium]